VLDRQLDLVLADEPAFPQDAGEQGHLASRMGVIILVSSPEPLPWRSA
jgi:hypothetical protein